MEKVNPAWFQWGAAMRPIDERSELGDLYLVKHLPEGMLIAVVDGIGHGTEASSASKTAMKTLEKFCKDPIPVLVTRSHDALRQTRGVVLSLGVIDPGQKVMTWMGIGNVQGILLRANPEANPKEEVLLLRNGVVGVKLPELNTTVVSLFPGDTLVFSTDGIADYFQWKVKPEGPPQEMADMILKENFRGLDDALVWVGRYLPQA